MDIRRFCYNPDIRNNETIAHSVYVTTSGGLLSAIATQALPSSTSITANHSIATYKNKCFLRGKNSLGKGRRDCMSMSRTSNRGGGFTAYVMVKMTTFPLHKSSDSYMYIPLSIHVFYRYFMNVVSTVEIWQDSIYNMTCT